jgi:predicted ester cyclase
VAARGRLTGTNTGPWLGQPPTNKPVNISWMAIYRFEAGKITERWLNGDDLAMMQQLGLAPTSPA